MMTIIIRTCTAYCWGGVDPLDPPRKYTTGLRRSISMHTLNRTRYLLRNRPYYPRCRRTRPNNDRRTGADRLSEHEYIPGIHTKDV
jgi:hypothetical protein